MQAFKKIVSQAIPLEMDNVDTDMIIPAQYLTKVDDEGYGQYLFQRLREQDSSFVFNDPCYDKAKVLISKSNFGCGSSREHAVWALMQAGIRAVIAESYSDIFFNNAAKNGLLLIRLPAPVIDSLLTMVKSSAPTMTIELDKQRVSLANQQSHRFEYDPFYKECLIKGQDELDYLLEVTA